MPKVEKDLKDKWREKFLFCLFLGFGTSALFLIIGQIIASFFAAVTGLNMGRILIGSFIPFHLISLVLSTWFFSKEIERLNYFGLEYQSNMGESESDDELIDTSETEKLTTLKMLTILNLKTTVKMDELKSRYFELSKIYHPDRLNELEVKDREIAEREFKRIKEAYDYLKEQIAKGNI